MAPPLCAYCWRGGGVDVGVGGSVVAFAAFRSIASEELRINYKIAKTKALYNAHTGIAESGFPYMIQKGAFESGDTILSINPTPVIYNNQLYMGDYSPIEISYNSGGDLQAESEGVAYVRTAKGDTVPVTASAKIAGAPESFSKFMYFTNEELAGGSPFVFGSDGTAGTPAPGDRRQPNFSTGDILYGIVQSNESPLTMSSLCCPNFNNAVVYVSRDCDGNLISNPFMVQSPSMGGFYSYNQLWSPFILANCGDCSQNGIINDECACIQPKPQLLYPPDLSYTQSGASSYGYTFDAGRLLLATNGGGAYTRDQLIMTDIEFTPSAVIVTEYSYIIPPRLHYPDILSSGNNAAPFSFQRVWHLDGVYNSDGVTIPDPGQAGIPPDFLGNNNEYCYDVNHNGVFDGDECELTEQDLCRNSGLFGADIRTCLPYIDALYYYHAKGYDLDTFINDWPYENNANNANAVNKCEWCENDPEDEEPIAHTVSGPHSSSQHFDVLESSFFNSGFDKSPIAKTKGLHYIQQLSQTQLPIGEYVIHVEDGPVRVKGTYKGRYTVLTGNFNDSSCSACPEVVDDCSNFSFCPYTTYQRHADKQNAGTKIDTLYNNIWITGDLINYDSLSQDLDDYQSEACEEGVISTNALGLVSGANVIIANTPASQNDITIHASILASHESFVTHYWQNSWTDNVSNNVLVVPSRTVSERTNAPPWSDGRGSVEEDQDNRGEIIFWGSIVQKYRGYMRRNDTSPFGDGFPAHYSGYTKNYRYNDNLLCDGSKPPFFPKTSNKSPM